MSSTQRKPISLRLLRIQTIQQIGDVTAHLAPYAEVFYVTWNQHKRLRQLWRDAGLEWEGMIFGVPVVISPTPEWMTMTPLKEGIFRV